MLQIGSGPKHDSTFTLTKKMLSTDIDVLQTVDFHAEEPRVEDLVFPGYKGVMFVEATGAKARNCDLRLGGAIANRSAATDQIDKYKARIGLKLAAHFPGLDVTRRSRLKKSTLFEMEHAPGLEAAQKEYTRLAAALRLGSSAPIAPSCGPTSRPAGPPAGSSRPATPPPGRRCIRVGAGCPRSPAVPPAR